MKRVGVLVLVVLSCAVVPQAASARGHVKPHCRAHFVRKRVRVHVRRHHRLVWVREWRCVRKHPVAATRVLRYRARVDPTFTQAPNDPLTVTYAYSADATANGVDLAAAGQLPPGVLSFYSATAAGGPQNLYCSVNVGGATLGGDCRVHYPGTGTFAVTTQYIPNAATAVTETDQETISPYATTTTLSATQTGCAAGSPPGYPTISGPYCAYTVSNTAADQNGNPVGPKVGLLATPDSGQPAQGSQVPADGSCTVYVTSTSVLSPDCNFEDGSSVPATSWNLTAEYAGTTGWAASASAPVAVTP